MIDYSIRRAAALPALALGVVLFLALAPAHAAPEFRVTFDRSVRDKPASGRLIIYLVKANSPIDLAGQDPSEGPFFESPQPMYAIDVSDLAPGERTVLDKNATGFPGKLTDLPEGRYKMQAVLDLHRLDSSWRREPGNLFSKIQVIDVDRGLTKTIDVELNQVVVPERRTSGAAIEYVEIPSALLTKFRGSPVTLRAGVLLPTGYKKDAGRKYPAVYEIPGFGGDDRSISTVASMRRAGPFTELLKNCFWITLNPEGPNGHHLFADSANNGPVGESLVRELIPALEAKYGLIADPSARITRGHSSGGWSSAWLAVRYPETFGAAWSSSPDPVDFAHFQIPDIYTDASMYTRSASPGSPTTPVETPSYRDTGDTRMSIRQENLMEEVLGPANTSGQQWDSWMAVFGPRGKDGNPATLYDPLTGKLDHAVAASFRAYDLTDMLRTDPAKYAPIFKQRIRIVCGGEDSYFLEGAVNSLKAELEGAKVGRLPEGEHGYVKVVPGRDHGTIFATPEMRGIPVEMLEHLRRAGHVPK